MNVSPLPKCQTRQVVLCRHLGNNIRGVTKLGVSTLHQFDLPYTMLYVFLSNSMHEKVCSHIMGHVPPSYSAHYFPLGWKSFERMFFSIQ